MRDTGCDIIQIVKILEVKSLAIPDVKVIKYGRYNDHRGYFTETFRKSDFKGLDFMKGVEFLQCNEGYSKAGTFRGFHFQWNPYMGKLVRVISGHLIDMALDVRKGSPTFGKMIAYDMTVSPANDHGEWIWLPPGFGHGILLTEESTVEYFCSGEYSPACEASISPLAGDIDWSICDPKLKKVFDSIVPKTKLMTDKDRNGFTLAAWSKEKNSDQFIYGKV
jgi:dTDP-4-dehydrorhamnose 3,5-epimerase